MKFGLLGETVRAAAIVSTFAVASNGLAQSASEQTTMQDVKNEVRDVTQTIKDYSAERRDEAINEARAALDQLDARIDALETSIANRSDLMSKATRTRARSALKSLREQRNRVAEWYGGLKHSSRDAWDHVKQGFSESYSALRSAWDEVRKEFDDSA